MLAAGVTPPLLNLKSLSPGRAQGYPVQDQFKSLLQQRIVSRGYSGSSSSSRSLSREVVRAQLRQARPTKSTSPLATSRSRLSRHSLSSKPHRWIADSKSLRTTRRLMDLKDRAKQTQQQEQSLLSAGAADSSSQSWKANLRSRALKLAQLAQDPTQAAAVAPGTIEMPQVLKDLIALLNQQPGQALKVPPDRIPEVEAFLLKTGLPPVQVENLLSSPRFQEQGLTATAIQSAWQKAVQDTLQQNAAATDLQAPVNSGSAGPVPVSTGQTPAAVNPLLSITSQSDYQRLWQNLTLPSQALPELRLALQQLGMPPEALTNLNVQNFPQGIPLTQVWELIQQIPKSPTATANAGTNNITPESPLLLNGGQDVEQWRQFLVQAGMDPELAKVLVSGPSPTNREELQTGLLKMAPPASPPQSQDIPKPLYLPEDLRVRQIPVLQQENLGQSPGEGSGNNGNLGLNLGSASKSPEITLPVNPNLNNFLALLAGDVSPKAEQSAFTGASGGSPSAVNTLLTPEAREALWAQVQTGVLGNLRPGENQVTLTLNPPEMGKLHLTLNVKGEMVEVSATATHQAVAEAGTAGVQQLAQALNQQGLTLTHFQFHHQDEAPKQSNLAFFQNSGDQRQSGQKDPDNWEQPANPQPRRWGRGIDCFA